MRVYLLLPIHQGPKSNACILQTDMVGQQQDAGEDHRDPLWHARCLLACSEHLGSELRLHRWQNTSKADTKHTSDGQKKQNGNSSLTFIFVFLILYISQLSLLVDLKGPYYAFLYFSCNFPLVMIGVHIKEHLSSKRWAECMSRLCALSMLLMTFSRVPKTFSDTPKTLLVICTP